MANGKAACGNFFYRTLGLGHPLFGDVFHLISMKLSPSFWAAEKKTFFCVNAESLLNTKVE